MIKKIKYIIVSIGILLQICSRLTAQTVDLSIHTTSTATSPIQLQWHNSATPSSSTKLASTIVTATTTPTNYWVYYYDSTNMCYSPGNKVTVVTNTCPTNTVNLTALTVAPTAPVGSVLQWHTVNTGFVQSGAGQTLVSSPGAVGNGTYYPIFYDSGNNCYSPVGTPVIVSINACASVGPDSDGDGINDLDDLDDDNDGILDCDEKSLTGQISNVFELNGTATMPNANEVQLTANSALQSGQMWSYGKVDFTKSFTLSYEAYLGNNDNGIVETGDNGADGIASVFHNSPLGVNATGANGMGLGARGIANGIVLELDTYSNISDPVNDIAGDHGQIWDSDNQTGAGFLTSPVALSNLENGAWHPVVVTWDAVTQTISYTVDGVTAGTYTGDLVTNYFGGASKVYFGFTASTGSAFNSQRIRFANFCSDLPLELDTDGDGIPNHLDLDSDNDGCADALEGDENVNSGMLVTAAGTVDVGAGSTSPKVNLCATSGTTCIDAQGVPKVVNTGGGADVGNDVGQGVGSSVDASVNICNVVSPDSDGDGINDLDDLDDDNDGILDCDEKSLTGQISNVFELNGTSTMPNANEVQLTAASGGQSGQMWSYGKVDFSKSFTLRYEAYLGNDDNGADGIATVFHNSPLGVNAIGIGGNGVGARGIANGIVLELDTYENPTDGVGDIASDHGQIWDSDNQAGAGLLTTAVAFPNLENGAWHPVVVNWDAASQTISYTIDGVTAGAYTGDLVTNYFGGASKVYFGFTASTGGFTNQQKIRFSNFCSDLPLELDTDGDGIPNHLDLDSDNDGCPDATEGDENVLNGMLVTAGGTVGVGVGSTSPKVNLCATSGTTCIDAQGVPIVVNTGGGADVGNDVGQGVGSSVDALVNTCYCYKPATTTGTTLSTNHGITALGRAGLDNADNWPMVRKGAWTALEAKTKGFVINRLSATDISSIPVANCIDGMLVYDTTNDCLKMYTTKDGGATYGWYCLNVQTCPDY